MRSTILALVSGVLFSSLTQASPFQTLSLRGAVSVPGYGYEGCFTEATQGRALSGSAYYDDLMTVEKCAAACSTFALFGVEYGRECFCGGELNAGSVLAAEEECSFNCQGNSGQTCGAGNRLNVYKKTPTTTSSSTTLATTATPTPGAYVDKGCWSEPANGIGGGSAGRALSGPVFRDDDQTIEKCAASCAGFAFFGVEYGRECYCGSTISLGSDSVSASECSYKCAGDSSQNCGGDWKIKIYSFTDTPLPTPTPTPGPINYASEGCYTDSPANRALTGAALTDASMTLEMCSAVCSGWSLFGVEYGVECYCGASLQGESTVVATGECSLGFPCGGNSGQRCGAGDRIHVYRYTSTVSSSTLTTSTTVPITTPESTSSSVISSSTPESSSTTSEITTSSSTSISSSTSTTTTTTTTSTTTTTTTTTTTATPTPTTCSVAGNLVKNYSFEEGASLPVSEWTQSVGSATNYGTTAANTNAVCGTKVLSYKFSGASGPIRFYNDVGGLTIGRQYTAAVSVRRAGKVTANCSISTMFASTVTYGNAVNANTALSTEWQRITATWTANAAVARIQLVGTCPSGEEIYWDSVTFIVVPL